MPLDNEAHFREVEVPGHNGERVRLAILTEDRKAVRDITVLSDATGMHAYAQTSPREGFKKLERADLLAVVAQAGIVFGLSEEAVGLYLAMVNGSKPYTGYFEIARGDPMRRGENGDIEFHVQPSRSIPEYDENEEGSVDFKQLNLIENCFLDQRVASILPPGLGRPGRTVMGKEIPPTPGTPLAVRPGAGIQLSANGRDFTSQQEGRLVYEDGVLSVSPLLEIHRDIDYSVGNIDFIGKVVIRGSLLDGFSVTAKMGMELFGDVGAGRINSEGDVKISGGIKGKNAAMIACRNLTAHYIDDASVEATGDVKATKEIMNSSVKALGRVTVTSGAIIGGVVCGFRGVEADTLGSDMGVSTTVMTGLDWTSEDRKSDIRRQLAEYMEQIQSSKMILETLFQDKELSTRLTNDQKTMLSDIAAELRTVRELVADLLEERARITGSRQLGMVNQINVRKIAYMGVVTKFSIASGEIKDTVKGPVTFLQDSRSASVLNKPLTALPQTPPASAATDEAPL